MKRLFISGIALAVAFAVTACSGANDAKTSAEETAVNENIESSTGEITEDSVEEKTVYYDFSNVPIQTSDTSFPNGAVFWSDVSEAMDKVYTKSGPIKVGFVMKTLVNEYWSTMKAGIEEEVERLKEAGVNIEVDIQAGASDSDKEGQLAVLRSMINSGYDVIVACPISDANLTPGIEEAIDAGIPVVSVNTCFDEDPYIPYYIGASFYAQGQAAAEWFADNNPDGAKVAVIMGLADAASSIGCTDGFKSYVENNPDLGLEIVDIQSADWDRVRAQEITSTILKQNPDIKGIFCLNDVMAIGAVEAVKQAGMLDQVKVIGRDGSSEAIESIKNKELSATIGQFPLYMGKACLQLAVLAEQNVEMPDRIWFANDIIDQNNCDTPEAEIINWKDAVYEIVE